MTMAAWRSQHGTFFFHRASVSFKRSLAIENSLSTERAPQAFAWRKSKMQGKTLVAKRHARGRNGTFPLRSLACC
jgi:hypothetical protein